jgi:catechol 2,3-dioxygenase-like lactoylglutathione lyase family enzyme
MITEIAFSGYPVTDMARSRKFYEGLLGLKPALVSERVPWVEYEIGSATFALGNYPVWKPSRDGGMVAFEVDDFENTIGDLKKAGVTFTFESTETPVCHFAIVSDPDNNAVMIHKRKPGHP